MTRSIEFPPFRLDLDADQLRRGTERVPLRPKTLAVLRHLAARPGCAVSKADLMAAVWPDTHVDEAALKVCINELRRALGDDAQHPVVLETVRGRGYRFLPEVQGADRVRPSRVPPCFVGRGDELAALARALDDARRGVRRLVLVSGDAGIGKTSVVEAFLSACREVAVGVGHCADRPGAGDVFQPFIEALAEACRGPDEARLRDRLRDVAPSWLLHLPGPMPPAEREALRRALAGATRAAVIRELGLALRAVGELRPLILVLEDLHRADEATHDALAALARGDDRARVLLVGTLRPVESVPGTVTLLHELARRRLARELRLAPFGAAEVRSYLAERLGAAAPDGLADSIMAHTGGNPLFVTAVAERLEVGGDATIARVPETLRHLLADDLAHLPAAERATLEAAAVAGLRFMAPALALALDEPVEAIEARLGAMSRLRTPIRTCGTRRWADGSDAAAFEFVHAVHRDVVLEHVPPARRARLHAEIGRCLEQALPGGAGERAPELALHFDRAGDVERARRYHEQAGVLATERHAHATAVLHLERALALLPAGGRAADELRLRTALGPMLMNARGFASPDVERNYARALALCDEAGERAELFPVLEGLQSHYAINGRMATAHALSQRMEALGARLGDRAMQVEADHTTGIDFFKLGRPADAIVRLGAALARYDDDVAEQGFRWCGHDARVCCAAHLGVCRWHSANPAAAAQALDDALAHARRLRQPASLAIALTANAWMRIQRADVGGALELLDELARLAVDDELPFWGASAALFTGWAQTLAGDIDAARASLDRANAGAAALGPHVLGVERRLVTAGWHAAVGEGAVALSLLADAEALHAEHDEVYLQGDIALLRGTVLLASGATVEARDALETALAFGEHRGFLPLALRAALVLSYCADDGAGDVLARVVARFGDGRDVPEVVQARSRLGDLV